jgi:integrase
LSLKTRQNELFTGESYKHFINAIKSPATRAGYENSLKRYLNHLKLREIDDLLLHISFRDNGVSYSTIKFLVAPIFTFYQLNDLVLNRKKVSRYLGEYKRVVRDEAYSTEHIQKALQNADQRIRMIILLLSSTGARIGSLPSLVLRNLVKLPDYGLYRITFYEGTNNEYYTFTTRECAATGIDTYLQYRQRCGEKLSFNETTQRWEPDDTPLIRQQFDVNDILQVRNPRPLAPNALRKALDTHLVKSGISSMSKICLRL